METPKAKSSKNSVTIVKTITNCSECDAHVTHQIYTPDSFEHEFGLYCTKVPDTTESWMRNTMGTSGPTNFKIVAQDDHCVEDCADIPDWCPLLKDAQVVFTQDELRHRLEAAGIIRSIFNTPR